MTYEDLIDDVQFKIKKIEPDCQTLSSLDI